YSNMSLDGINIQNNYIRDNALDYTPNKPRVGQVRQVPLITSNPTAAASGGATETAFSTPSGGNQFHGEVFWYNRNNHFAANDWFNNQAGIGRPFLNQNQFGGDIGGPIRKDKLFFYASYEGIRAHQQMPQDFTILTPDARNGIFTYSSGGISRKVNLLTLRNLTGVDSGMQAILAQVPGGDKINNSDTGDGRNTGGYRFNQRNNELLDNLTGKIDYNITTRHAVSGTYAHNRDNSDRPDYSNNYGVVPSVTNPTHASLVALSWRWTPSATLTNEVRGGFNLTYAYFLNAQDNVSSIVVSPTPTGTTDPLFTNPINESQAQGRTTNTYNLSDDAAWQHGRHYVQFGFHFQRIGVESYDRAGVIPTFTLFMGAGQQVLARRELPGISSADLATANALLATLGGYIDRYDQTFNVTSVKSGYVNNAPFLRHFASDDYSFYVQDKWKLLPRLTLTLGLRYQLPGVVDERDSLEIAPVLTGTAQQTLLSNATLNFAGKSAGRRWYNREKKDFAPNIGFAWDVFGNGKTALRGGYSMSYVNDQSILAPESLLELNAGLQGFASDTGLSNRVSTGLPKVLVPDYHIPRTVADNYVDNPFNAVGMIDPGLRHPRVQQYSIGVQHDFKGTVFEARYVGNHVVGAYRAFDYNQVVINSNGYLQDFLRAQNNGFLAVATGRSFNPAYNAAIAGSQPLTVLTKLVKGALTDENALYYLQTGEVGELGTYYQTNGYNPTNAVPFFQNPNALGTDLLTNYSSSSYNALQVEVRRRTKSGLFFEGNYTWSKVLSDADGDSQNRLQHFLDLANPKIERSRANFDLTHMIKMDGYYELPFGKGHKLSYGRLDRVIGGWVLGGTLVWQSGAPFSVLSGRGTLNRESRSYYNSANTSLNKGQLESVVKFQMTGNGPMMITQSAINPTDGTGVNTDGEAAFKGQIFFNPGAGTLGVLQRRLFDSPWTFNTDMRLKKTIPITETKKLELAMDAINALNHATFWSGDQNINSTTFGVISYMFYQPRVVQFGVHYTF
ncbi:MAG: TonB-dependent receptor, partial [Candidatus Solibacter sp.]|nr:TonB-dependent receptor [Candidatus Solibacter sp.]